MGTRKGEIIFETLVPRGRVLTSEDEVYFESMGLSKLNELYQVPINDLRVSEFLDNFDAKKKESFVDGQRIIISAQLLGSLLGSGSDGQSGPGYLPPEREPNWPPEWPAHFIDGNDAHDRSYGWPLSKVKPEYKKKYEWFGRVILLKCACTHLSNGAAMVLVNGEKGKREVNWGGFLFRNFFYEIKRIIRTRKSGNATRTVIGQIICMILDATKQNIDGEVPELTCQLKRSSKLEKSTTVTAGGECSKNVLLQYHDEPRTLTEMSAPDAPGDDVSAMMLSMDQKKKDGVEECRDVEITPAIDINKLTRTGRSIEQLQHIGAASIDYEQQQQQNVSEATNTRIHPASLGFVGDHEEVSRTHISGLPDDINSKHVCPCPSRSLRSQSSLEYVKEGCNKKRKRDADKPQLSVGNVIVHQQSTAREFDELEEGQTMLEQEKPNCEYPVLSDILAHLSDIRGPGELNASEGFSKHILGDVGLSSEKSSLVVSNCSGGASGIIIATDLEDASPLILPSGIDFYTKNNFKECIHFSEFAFSESARTIFDFFDSSGFIIQSSEIRKFLYSPDDEFRNMGKTNEFWAIRNDIRFIIELWEYLLFEFQNGFGKNLDGLRKLDELQELVKLQVLVKKKLVELRERWMKGVAELLYDRCYIDELLDSLHPTTIHSREDSYTMTRDEEFRWSTELWFWKNFWRWTSLVLEILAGKKSTTTIQVIFSQQRKVT